MARSTVSFATLEKAFWNYVESNCPHPVQSRHRYTWVRRNLTFTYAGMVYERRSTTLKRASGAAVHAITYTAADGTLIEELQDVHPIMSFA